MDLKKHIAENGTMLIEGPEDQIKLLLERAENPHRPSLESRVAFQWEPEGDMLGHFSGSKKNRITLDWLVESLEQNGKTNRAVLDVGCAYGNMLLMLNARMGKQRDVRMVGIDLHPESMRYARAFAELPGYSNCEFQVANLSGRLPFENATFDAVNLGDVLEHMEKPAEALRELMRVTKPGGVILISTPLKNSLFKRVAAFGNKLSGGRLYREYYRGKETELDLAGKPVMITKIGHGHISEMTLSELELLLRNEGLAIEKMEMMPVMSGSKWFDRHLFVLSGLIFIEAVHSILKCPSWAHSVMMLARKSHSAAEVH